MKQRPKFSPFGDIKPKTVRTPDKQKICPKKAYFEAVRIVELQALSGDDKKF
ncbi:MAG: hypothetical protein ACR2K1_08350 [Saprospiraceae bacterium]